MRRGKQDQEETKAEKGMTPKSMHEGILKNRLEDGNP
jgi:hypothetical protein